MKKMYLVLVFLVFASWVYAVDFKILGGINLSRSTEPLAGPWIEEYSATTQYGAGVLFGAGVEFSLSQSVALEVDGLYFQKGSRLEFRYWDEVVGHSIDRMNELSFPVLLPIFLEEASSPLFSLPSLILIIMVSSHNVPSTVLSLVLDYGSR
jgi:hypothetical protein